MLLAEGKSKQAQVAVLTRNRTFKRLLCSILADWKFAVTDDPAEAKVVLVERGLTLSGHNGLVVQLTPMPLAEGTFLSVPISLTGLYRFLSNHFFPTARKDIRIAMNLPITVATADKQLPGEMVSLSCRGGRLTIPLELPLHQVVQIEMTLEKHLLSIPSNILYCIPAGDSPGWLQPHIGVGFGSFNLGETSRIRNYIETTCVARSCAKEGVAVNDLALNWFDIPAIPPLD